MAVLRLLFADLLLSCNTQPACAAACDRPSARERAGLSALATFGMVILNTDSQPAVENAHALFILSLPYISTDKLTEILNNYISVI